MKRHSSSAFSTAILAMAMAAAGLFPARQAQAQKLHYGPDGGRECWATPQAGGYQMEFNAPGEGIDGDTRYLGVFQIVSTDGDKTYVQGSVTGGGNTYYFQPTSYFTPSEHFYYATWPHNGGQQESKTLYNDNPPPANTLTAKATDNEGAVTKSSSRDTRVITMRDPDNPAHTVNGLDYAYYLGSWGTLPDFSGMTPTKTGTEDTFDIVTERTVADGYALVFKGYVNVPSDGAYTFYTTSDDGSMLYIGTQLVVNNDGRHAPAEASGVIGLKTGKHAIRVPFMESGGGELLEVRYEGPGISKQLIPKSALFRVRPGK